MPKKQKKLDMSDEQRDPLEKMDEEDEGDMDDDIDPKKLKNSGLHIEGDGDTEDPLLDDEFSGDGEDDEFDDDDYGEDDEW